jgi:two-component system sensor histidine kinase/response regulator
VVLTSSYASASVRERERAGILRCVHKPIRQAELHEVLCSALRGPRDTGADSPRRRQARPARSPAACCWPRTTRSTSRSARPCCRSSASRGALRRQRRGGAAPGLDRETFDLILMDCHMPVMDGYEASAAIRALNGAPRVPIVALTANVMEGNRERCLAAGMDDFLAKPYSLEQLQSTLQRWHAQFHILGKCHRNTRPSRRHGQNGSALIA